MFAAHVLIFLRSRSDRRISHQGTARYIRFAVLLDRGNCPWPYRSYEVALLVLQLRTLAVAVHPTPGAVKQFACDCIMARSALNQSAYFCFATVLSLMSA